MLNRKTKITAIFRRLNTANQSDLLKLVKSVYSAESAEKSVNFDTFIENKVSAKAQKFPEKNK